MNDDLKDRLIIAAPALFPFSGLLLGACVHPISAPIMFAIAGLCLIGTVLFLLPPVQAARIRRLRRKYPKDDAE